MLSSSLVSFGVKQRAIGESAKTAEISNYKNTVGSLKRLIGRTLDDPEIRDFESKFVTAKLVDVQGSVGVQVCHSEQIFPEETKGYLIHGTNIGKLPW